MNCLRFSGTESDEFFVWCRSTIFGRPYRDLVAPYDDRQDAIVLSFDVNLNPFFGNAWGQNESEQKTPFKNTPLALKRIREEMLALPTRRMGGRIFITNNRSYYRDYPLPYERKICDLTWPEDLDIVGKVRDAWRELPKSRSSMTIRLAATSKG